MFLGPKPKKISDTSSRKAKNKQKKSLEMQQSKIIYLYFNSVAK